MLITSRHCLSNETALITFSLNRWGLHVVGFSLRFPCQNTSDHVTIQKPPRSRPSRFVCRFDLVAKRTRCSVTLLKVQSTSWWFRMSKISILVLVMNIPSKLLMLCAPEFIFTSGSSALFWSLRYVLSIWLSLLAYFTLNEKKNKILGGF